MKLPFKLNAFGCICIAISLALIYDGYNTITDHMQQTSWNLRNSNSTDVVASGVPADLSNGDMPGVSTRYSPGFQYNEAILECNLLSYRENDVLKDEVRTLQGSFSIQNKVILVTRIGMFVAIAGAILGFNIYTAVLFSVSAVVCGAIGVVYYTTKVVDFLVISSPMVIDSLFSGSHIASDLGAYFQCVGNAGSMQGYILENGYPAVANEETVVSFITKFLEYHLNVMKAATSFLLKGGPGDWMGFIKFDHDIIHLYLVLTVFTIGFVGLVGIACLVLNLGRIAARVARTSENSKDVIRDDIRGLEIANEEMKYELGSMGCVINYDLLFGGSSDMMTAVVTPAVLVPPSGH